MIHSINPSTGKLIKEYNPYSNGEVLSIIDEVSNQYVSWRSTSFKNRSKVLYGIADALNGNVEEHARMISLEIGKPIKESRMEVEKCVWVLKYFAENAEEFLKSESIIAWTKFLIWKNLSKKHGLAINISGLPSLAKFSFKSKNSQTYKTFITQIQRDKVYT